MLHHSWPRRRPWRRALALLGGALLCGMAVGALSPQARGDEPGVSARVGKPGSGPPMATGFVGVSMEYWALHVYSGRDPNHVNPVLVALLRGLSGAGGAVLRVGGDSTDQTWWPMPGVLPPGGVNYRLTLGWLRTARALALSTGSKLILGVNLAARRAALAATEARALLFGIGRSHVAALEVGNEPDLYPTFAWGRDRNGRVLRSRPPGYGVDDFLSEFAHWRAAMPPSPLAGPAFSGLRWMPALGRLLRREPRMAAVTFHRYPLRACVSVPSNPSFASIDHLLADSSSAGLAAGVAPYVAVAHARGLPFRLDELNSASCRGRRGTSDTFAAALWLLDTLFNMAAVGVDAVNLHTLPGAPYEPFSFSRDPRGWHAFVHPSYYGALMFARAFPPGARLLPVSVPNGPVKVWATAGADRHVRVVVINQQPGTAATVSLQLPSQTAPLSTQALSAPSLTATDGVTLAGQTFGQNTDTGTLPGNPHDSVVWPRSGGGYQFSVGAGQALLLTQ